MFDENHLLPDPKPSKAKNYIGYSKTGAGYLQLYKPSHPYARAKTYVFYHRLVVEFHIGRYLLPDEYVHHKDENKENNDINNLQILTDSEHRALHNILNKKGKKFYDSAEIAKLYKNGLSTRQIAELLDIGKTTVANYVKELGLSRPNLQNRCPFTNQFVRIGQKTNLPKRNDKGQFKGG